MNLSLICLLSISSEKEESPAQVPPYLGHLFPSGLGTSSPTEIQLGSPSRGEGDPGGREKRPRKSQLQLLGSHMKTKLQISYKCVGDLGPASVCSVIGGPASRGCFLTI